MSRTKSGCSCGTCVQYHINDCKKNVGCNACNPVGIAFNQPHEEWVATQKKLMTEQPERYVGVSIPKMLLV